MSQLTYVKGDVTEPQGEGPKMKLIPHVCNDIGAWGAGVSGAIGKKFPEAESNYRDRHWYRLGEVDFVKTDQGIIIANMVAQHGTKLSHQPGSWMEAEGGKAILRPPIRYSALVHCMREVKAFCYADAKPWCSIHAPRFGSALAGGHWPTIEALILELWVDADIEVTVYDFE